MTTDYDEILRRHAAPVLERAAELRREYEGARPWPHVLLPDLLAPEVVAAAYEQEKGRAADLVLHRNHRQAKAETAEGFGPAAQAILDFLTSPDVVDFVGAVTGVDGLEPDPTHTWAGLHANPRGAFHAIHHDFPRHPVDGRWHRVNILVYLNPEWPDEWAGRLELWEQGGTEPGAIVRPCAPSLVLFESSTRTIHGLPDPIAAPDGIARLSLNAFYYTHEPAEGASRFEPLLGRPRRPSDPWFTGIATRWEVIHGVRLRTPQRWRSLRRRLFARSSRSAPGGR